MKKKLIFMAFILVSGGLFCMEKPTECYDNNNTEYYLPMAVIPKELKQLFALSLVTGISKLDQDAFELRLSLYRLSRVNQEFYQIINDDYFTDLAIKHLTRLLLNDSDFKFYLNIHERKDITSQIALKVAQNWAAILLGTPIAISKLDYDIVRHLMCAVLRCNDYLGFKILSRKYSLPKNHEGFLGLFKIAALGHKNIKALQFLLQELQPDITKQISLFCGNLDIKQEDCVRYDCIDHTKNVERVLANSIEDILKSFDILEKADLLVSIIKNRRAIKVLKEELVNIILNTIEEDYTKRVQNRNMDKDLEFKVKHKLLSAWGIAKSNGLTDLAQLIYKFIGEKLKLIITI